MGNLACLNLAHWEIKQFASPDQKYPNLIISSFHWRVSWLGSISTLQATLPKLFHWWVDKLGSQHTTGNTIKTLCFIGLHKHTAGNTTNCTSLMGCLIGVHQHRTGNTTTTVFYWSRCFTSCWFIPSMHRCQSRLYGYQTVVVSLNAIPAIFWLQTTPIRFNWSTFDGDCILGFKFQCHVCVIQCHVVHVYILYDSQRESKDIYPHQV